MANVVRVEPGKLGSMIRSDAAAIPGALKRGAKRAAQRTRTRLVRTMPVDRGILKNAWEIKAPASGVGAGFSQGLSQEFPLVELVNTAPYAGIVERGARPFRMPPGLVLAVLVPWVKRKILGGGGSRKVLRSGPATPLQNARATAGGHQLRGGSWEDEAKAIAFAIAKKFEREGIIGKFLVQKDLPNASRDASDEILREVTKYFQKRTNTGPFHIESGGDD